MFKNPIDKLKGKVVIVRAGGFTYEGKLIEVTADYLLIRRQTGFSQIEMSRVQSVEAKDKPIANSGLDHSAFDKLEAELDAEKKEAPPATQTAPSEKKDDNN